MDLGLGPGLDNVYIQLQTRSYEGEKRDKNCRLSSFNKIVKWESHSITSHLLQLYSK